MSIGAEAKCRGAAWALEAGPAKGLCGAAMQPMLHSLACVPSQRGQCPVICTKALALFASGSPASQPNVLGVDCYSLVKYCPHSWAGCSFNVLSGWGRGGEDRSQSCGLRQQSQKAPTSFPLSAPLRRNFNSAFQQDTLTRNLAQHAFLSPPQCLVIHEIKEITLNLYPYPTNRTIGRSPGWCGSVD